MDFFFCHLHKTGGISFQNMLKELYPKENCFDVSEIFIDQDRFYSLSDRVVYGHALFCLKKHLGTTTKNYSILRNPIDRVVSYWKHITRERQNIQLKSLFSSLRYKEVLSSPLFETCNNYQTKVLGAEIDFTPLFNKVYAIPEVQEKTEYWTREYNKLISSILSKPCTQEMFERAQEVVKTEQFGVFEMYDESVRKLFLSIDKKITSVPKDNKSFPQLTIFDGIGERVAIAELNKFDIKLYNLVWGA